MITITFEPQTPEQADLVGKFLKTYMAAEAAPAAEEAPAKKPKAPKPAPAAEQAPETPAPSQEPPASPSKTVTLVEVRAKLAALGHQGKADAVKAMLAARGVQKLSELPPEQLADVLAEAEGL